jgi:hypothetical protein
LNRPDNGVGKRADAAAGVPGDHDRIGRLGDGKLKRALAPYHICDYALRTALHRDSGACGILKRELRAVCRALENQRAGFGRRLEAIPIGR